MIRRKNSYTGSIGRHLNLEMLAGHYSSEQRFLDHRIVFLGRGKLLREITHWVVNLVVIRSHQPLPGWHQYLVQMALRSPGPSVQVVLL